MSKNNSPESREPIGELTSQLDSTERAMILKALEKHRWNKTKAAKELGLTLRTLRYRLEKLDIK